MSTTPVCRNCGDTHRMLGGDRMVMCTHCPVPCDKCRGGGSGPYCETTPCGCSCHAKPAPAPKAATPEPPPQPNHLPAVWDLVRNDIEARDSFGLKKYGTRLQPHNGRDALVDLYQELLDAVVYTRQLIFERDGR